MVNQPKIEHRINRNTKAKESYPRKSIYNIKFKTAKIRGEKTILNIRKITQTDN